MDAPFMAHTYSVSVPILWIGTRKLFQAELPRDQERREDSKLVKDSQNSKQKNDDSP
jgi:hypothetical protein